MPTGEQDSPRRGEEGRWRTLQLETRGLTFMLHKIRMSTAGYQPRQSKPHPCHLMHLKDHPNSAGHLPRPLPPSLQQAQ